MDGGNKKSAQDAHEAIRPTSTQYDPETVARLLSQTESARGARETEDLVRLYTLIWNRFVACQMASAVFDQTVIEIDAGRVGLRANGQVMRFAGYLAIYAEAQDQWGRNGYFLACSGYPDCRNTKEYTRNADGSLTVLPTTRPSDHICPTCASPMVIRRGRFGEFLACSRYPECKTTSPISLGVACPRPGCGGYLTEKRSRRGKVFFGCSNYSKTKCDFVTWDRPLAQRCPQCDAAFVVQKVSRAGVRLRCLADGCGWTAEPDADAEIPAAPDAKAS